ncbi:hypothetical protein NC652_029072 [Populus alba x Populus x berolinensis]|nr:hypothetical protein NC652_029072 [Populus alba x Populus x berolinensis]
MGNLGISLLFQEIEGFGLRNHSSNLNRIVVLRSDPVGESLPSQNWRYGPLNSICDNVAKNKVRKAAVCKPSSKIIKENQDLFSVATDRIKIFSLVFS